MDPRTDEQAIKRIIQAVFVDAWNAHDAVAFAQPFAEDADFTNVGGLHVHGRAEIERLHACLFDTVQKHSISVVTGIRVRLLRPDLAVVDVKWELSGHTNFDGVARSRVSVLGIVVMEQRDGAWVIVVKHNMVVPEDAAERNARIRALMQQD
jgi:uncharacterized protein (TIGR02246 family)